MKIVTVALVASVAVNAVLAAFISARRPPAAASVSVAAVEPGSRAVPSDSRLSALQSALVSGDFEALSAAGCPPEIARALAVGRAFDIAQAQMRNSRASRSDTKYWQPPPRSDDPEIARNRRLAEHKAERGFNEAIRRAYGEDLESLFNDRETRYAFLPLAKREQLRRIEQDYADLEVQISAASVDGIQLAADREKLALVRREKERDLDAALTPAEREQLEVHTSASANTVRNRFGSVLQTEDDYKKIYALQKAFDDQFKTEPNPAGPLSPDAARVQREARVLAQQQLEEQIGAALDPEQIATLRRTNDADRSTANSIVRRLGLPDDTADTVIAMRERYAGHSLRINADPNLSASEKRKQVQELAAKSQADLQVVLGAEGAEIYGARARWTGMLKNGNAFSTNPNDVPNATNTLTTSIYQVPPPSVTPPRAPVPAGN